ncbi:LCP family glycopolymer transferase [Tetragenococcus koreensis]|uniref:Polyisoprenyl-teichoic acid--peptidoglycan teichoic acid transferase TagU n=1 Tax=Tetragenococcus koreensis TaxID=290335 RepID=A0AAN4UBU3_9ENTE|nr:LCP family protein [Tetragenococcus koreensis]GEQ49555.1 LytR family transcriptional regulator [Tetragenococcus koreensis]GEQ52001.1 LytR family transcriptional regulator [Tetragenococcus koreensis]GEQ54536.1 LytR family transcriptional regulator [Tetragenococcus koreensis]GEQ57003.1 LytR family transcriptional regulator [Tetragenococcus koreensis]GEQ59568.1 LytR family transcriptional regulator [Tetragenococcus koreensis]
MANRRSHKKTSRGKKVFRAILIVILILVLAIIGAAVKVYLDVSGSADNAYENVDRDNSRNIDFSQEEPFSILLLGIDSGDLGRTEQGRSDTLMVATVNPKEKKSTLVSIPRDTYVDIVGEGKQDKINHAYAFGGAAMAMDTVSEFLDIPMDHYVSINMQGIKELVDAVGGVDVNNDLEFTFDDYTYDFGKIHLNGDQALGYLRMRHDDPEGDYGRQGRQRAVVQAVVDKALSLSGATQYRSILDALEGNMKTDLSFSDMRNIAVDYRGAFSNTEQLQLQGEGFTQDGVSYQRVDENELQEVQSTLQDQLQQ